MLQVKQGSKKEHASRVDPGDNKTVTVIIMYHSTEDEGRGDDARKVLLYSTYATPNGIVHLLFDWQRR